MAESRLELRVLTEARADVDDQFAGLDYEIRLDFVDGYLWDYPSSIQSLDANMRESFSLIALLLLQSTAIAEKAPLSVEDLKNEAQAIVVATIEEIRIESEAATFEGAGNWDWGIYLTLRVETVEKGVVDRDSLEARCFRIKSRRSLGEYATPSGHHPIPGIGTRVKAYLTNVNSVWNIVLPNGLTSVEEHGQDSSQRLSDAKEVTGLRSRAYTYFLPLEGWLLVLIISVPVAARVAWHQRQRRRQRDSDGIRDVE